MINLSDDTIEIIFQIFNAIRKISAYFHGQNRLNAGIICIYAYINTLLSK